MPLLFAEATKLSGNAPPLPAVFLYGVHQSWKLRKTALPGLTHSSGGNTSQPVYDTKISLPGNEFYKIGGKDSAMFINLNV
jgi:hypothetical protein